MFIHPSLSAKTVISNTEPSDYQPNGVDLRLERVFKLSEDGIFIIDEDSRINCDKEEIYPIDEYFSLDKGVYEIKFYNDIKVGEDEAGWVIVRSSLLRNGSIIFSALYDAGYEGTMVASLVCHVPMKIKKLTRVAQYVCVKSETMYLYNGSYGFGSHLTAHLN